MKTEVNCSLLLWQEEVGTVLHQYVVLLHVNSVFYYVTSFPVFCSASNTGVKYMYDDTLCIICLYVGVGQHLANVILMLECLCMHLWLGNNLVTEGIEEVQIMLNDV
jgi:hypothetical protein